MSSRPSYKPRSLVKGDSKWWYSSCPWGITFTLYHWPFPLYQRVEGDVVLRKEKWQVCEGYTIPHVTAPNSYSEAIECHTTSSISLKSYTDAISKVMSHFCKGYSSLANQSSNSLRNHTDVSLCQGVFEVDSFQMIFRRVQFDGLKRYLCIFRVASV